MCFSINNFNQGTYVFSSSYTTYIHSNKIIKMVYIRHCDLFWWQFDDLFYLPTHVNICLDILYAFERGLNQKINTFVYLLNQQQSYRCNQCMYRFNSISEFSVLRIVPYESIYICLVHTDQYFSHNFFL